MRARREAGGDEGDREWERKQRRSITPKLLLLWRRRVASEGKVDADAFLEAQKIRERNGESYITPPK